MTAVLVAFGYTLLLSVIWKLYKEKKELKKNIDPLEILRANKLTKQEIREMIIKLSEML